MSVMKCSGKNCNNEFQDRSYGAKMRVHNKCTKGWRCTVCLNIVAKTSELDKKPAKK